MPNQFTLLVLSDSHIGREGYALDEEEVIGALLKDITEMIAHRHTKPDAVVFSGDLAFSGKKEQYERAVTWITRLYSDALNATCKEIPFFGIPGNHDVDRDEVELPVRGFVDEMSSNRDAAEKIHKEMNTKPQFMDLMLKRQANWRAFMKSLENPRCTINEGHNSCWGVIKGASKTLGIAGLNSGWASCKDGEDGRLWIGKAQYQFLAEKLKHTDLKVFFAHHPLESLNPSDGKYLREKLETGPSTIFIHGHLHYGWLNDAERCLRIETGTSYQGSEKESAYCWINLNLDEKRASVVLREIKKGGGWGPYMIPGKTDDNGIATIHNLFGNSPIDTSSTHSAVGAEALRAPVGDSVGTFKDIPDTWKTIQILDTKFSCTWEPPKGALSSKPICVFWPVRLRKTSPIHALQSFIASALHQKGAAIVPFVDEFGTKEIPVTTMEHTIRAWFKKAGGDDKALAFRHFSDEIISIKDNSISLLIQEWLGRNNRELEHVLKVSKLWVTESDSTKALSQLASKRPRRLLTPAMIWTCLNILAIERNGDQIITLGGYDERPLWQAWRETITDGLHPGHLYISELMRLAPHVGSDPLYMGDPAISWECRPDLVKIIRNEMSNQQWHEHGRFIPWSITGLVLLPTYVTGTTHNVLINGELLKGLSDLTKLKKENTEDFIQSLASELSKWYL